MGKRERVIEIVEKISALRAELKRLDEEFAELVPDDVAAPNIPAVSGGHGSMPARVLALIGANPNRVFSTREIAEALKSDDFHLIRGTLFRLAGLGKIRKLERGQYGAAAAAAEVMRAAT